MVRSPAILAFGPGEVVPLHLLQVVPYHPGGFRVIHALTVRLVQFTGRDLAAIGDDVVERLLVSVNISTIRCRISTFVSETDDSITASLMAPILCWSARRAATRRASMPTRASPTAAFAISQMLFERIEQAAFLVGDEDHRHPRRSVQLVESALVFK